MQLKFLLVLSCLTLLFSFGCLSPDDYSSNKSIQITFSDNNQINVSPIELSQNNPGYFGKMAYFSKAKVDQIIKVDSNTLDLRLFVTLKNDKWFDPVYVWNYSGEQLKEGDIISLKSVIAGFTTYQSNLLGEITILGFEYLSKNKKTDNTLSKPINSTTLNNNDLVDCEDNFTCFKENLLNCNPAKFSTVLLNITYDFEINENCKITGTGISLCEINTLAEDYLINYIDLRDYCKEPIKFYNASKIDSGEGILFEDEDLDISIIKLNEIPDDLTIIYEKINLDYSLESNWKEEPFYIGVKNNSLKSLPIDYSILLMIKAYSNNSELELEVKGSELSTSPSSYGKLILPDKIVPTGRLNLSAKTFLPKDLYTNKIEYFGVNNLIKNIPKFVIFFEN